MQDFFVGAYDAGGTNARIAIADSKARIIARVKISTEGVNGKNLPALIAGGFEEALGLARKTLSIDRLAVLAGSQAGSCDRKGIILRSPNVVDGYGINMRAPLEEKFKAPFLLYNDGNAAALGVLRLDPNAARMKNILYLIMGTGIGSGIVIDGKIYEGFNGFAGEIGHVVIVVDGNLCGCGNKGCWEAYCGGRAIAYTADFRVNIRREESTLSMYKPIKSEHVFKEARNGDRLAKSIVDEVGIYNSVMVNNLANMFDPEAIFFGEALLNNDRQILEPIEAGLRCTMGSRPKLFRTTLEEPGLYGAIYAAIEHHKGSQLKP